MQEHRESRNLCESANSNEQEPKPRTRQYLEKAIEERITPTERQIKVLDKTALGSNCLGMMSPVFGGTKSKVGALQQTRDSWFD